MNEEEKRRGRHSRGLQRRRKKKKEKKSHNRHKKKEKFFILCLVVEKKNLNAGLRVTAGPPGCWPRPRSVATCERKGATTTTTTTTTRKNKEIENEVIEIKNEDNDDWPTFPLAIRCGLDEEETERTTTKKWRKNSFQENKLKNESPFRFALKNETIEPIRDRTRCVCVCTFKWNGNCSLFFFGGSRGCFRYFPRDSSRSPGDSCGKDTFIYKCMKEKKNENERRRRVNRPRRFNHPPP